VSHRLKAVAVPAAAIAAWAWLCWVNLNTVEVQPAAGSLLVLAMLFGAITPKASWAWALFFAAAIPLSIAWAGAVHYPMAYPAPRLYETAIALVPAGIGAAVGAGLGLVLRQQRPGDGARQG
jgi:hypothetical protein